MTYYRSIPSVITLNAVAASHAVNDFLFAVTGLTDPDAPAEYLRMLARSRDSVFDVPRADANCPECGSGPASRLVRGDGARLPTREAP